MDCRASLTDFIDYILNIIQSSRSLEEAYNRILELWVRVQTKSWEELERELFGR